MVHYQYTCEKWHLEVLLSLAGAFSKIMNLNAQDFPIYIRLKLHGFEENEDLISWSLQHDDGGFTYEPRHEKTVFFCMRKSATR